MTLGVSKIINIFKSDIAMSDFDDDFKAAEQSVDYLAALKLVPGLTFNLLMGFMIWVLPVLYVA